MVENIASRLPIAWRNMLFRCRLCGEKCCGLTPELSEEDVKKIRRAKPSFNPHYTPEGRMILVGEKGLCPFLRNGLCTIHDYKPLLCRLYPFYPVEKKVLEHFLSLPEDVEVVKHGSKEYVFLFDEQCPGVGEGDPVDFRKLLEAFLVSESPPGSF
ncbi:MAG: YkgJ family cysteine cluster protein [Candidatus Brockarchaeota archaeon]|nr:YkgJ family cysteine cluster protein [Candidatus Brockarchaeota archaeon]MBO3810176.1 YkgJ family cysteine cluster protein [Candidatus Brockarchaeota archaeon]